MNLGFANDAQAFNVVMATLLTVTMILVLRKVSTDSTSVWSRLSDRLAGRLSGKARNSTQHQRILQHIKHGSRILFHVLLPMAILGCVFAEFYYFQSIFASPFVDFESWSFGQVVGLAAWAGVLVDFAYLQYCESIISNLHLRFHYDSPQDFTGLKD